MQGRIPPIPKLHLKRLLSQALRYRGLLALTITASAINLGLIFVIPWLIGSAIDHVVAPDWVRDGLPGPPSTEDRMRWLKFLVITGVVTAIAFGTITFLRGHYTVKLGNRIIIDLRRELFEHLQRLSLHFYAKERTGSIVSRLINDIQQAGNLINGGVLLVIVDLLQTVLALGLLFYISWKLTLACIVILPLYVLTFIVFNKRVRTASDRVQSQISKISGTVQERLSGIALVKANDGEEREQQKFSEESEEHFSRIVDQSAIAHTVGAISETLVHFGTVIIIGYGSYLALQRDNGMSAGLLTQFLGYLGIMYGPIRRLSELNVVFQTSMAAVDRVYQVLDITPKIRDARRAIGKPPHAGEVRFEHVKFRYLDDSDESKVILDPPGAPNSEAAQRYVLDDLTFTVAPGECVAFVGPSGSGKSTLVSLLPRLYDVTEGSIVIDGVDVRKYKLRALRQAIAIVQQDSFLFSGTLRENLSYGRPNCTDKEIWAAIDAANCREFIDNLPEKLNTYLGERGVNMSGGQRQRLSIARAIIKNPRILILDEATSALDARSEAAVQGALDRLMAGRTSFIIAHRLSTVRRANRIFVLKQGRIVETGTHDSLLAQNGVYADYVRTQFGPAQEAIAV